MPIDILAADATSEVATMPVDQLRELLGQAIPELALGLWSLTDVVPLITVPRGSQRFTSCLTTWRDHTTGTDAGAELVVKEERKRAPRWADVAARQLSAAGMHQGAEHRIARPYGVLEAGALVSERAPGASLAAELRAAPDVARGAAVGGQLAGWLCRLQDLPVELPPSDRRGLDDVPAQLLELAVLDPDREIPGSAAALARLMRRLVDASRRVGPEAPTPCHGDLHPANVFSHREPSGRLSTVAIDLDTAAAREPAYDVGYAVCQLLVASLLAGVPLPIGRAAAAALWDGYRAGGGKASDERIAVQAARAIVQSMHFELVTYATGRSGLMHAWTSAALALLEHGRAGLEQVQAPAWAQSSAKRDRARARFRTCSENTAGLVSAG